MKGWSNALKRKTAYVLSLSETPSIAQMHTAGEPVCLTGVSESFMERNNVYWGYVKIVSVEKPATL